MDDEQENGGLPGWLWAGALVLLVAVVTAFLLHRG